WGIAPTEMYPLQLTLELEIAADYLQLYPLSEIGEASEFQIILPESPGHFLVNIDQLQDPTVWFGIAAIEGPLASTGSVEPTISVYPNPSSKMVFVKWPANLQMEQMELVAANGKILNTWKNEGKIGLQIDVADLPKGIYFLKMQNGERVFVEKLMVD
ncbi:MAG: T9SS type A sorting domain-containing protein, partial [Saprospiraceae bacterium]